MGMGCASPPLSAAAGRPRPACRSHLCSRTCTTTGKLVITGLSDVSVESLPLPDNDQASLTGAAYGFTGATTSLTNRRILTSSKKVTLVRHGLSTWNAESRVQGSSNLSVLTETGTKQAEKCRDALANIKFDVCFSSPISRAKTTAEIIWKDKEEPLVFLDSLKEAHLFFLEGMTNADAKKQYPELYTKWREDPAHFHVNGIYPLKEVWRTARQAWEQILLTPDTSMLRGTLQNHDNLVNFAEHHKVQLLETSSSGLGSSPSPSSSTPRRTFADQDESSQSRNEGLR